MSGLVSQEQENELQEESAVSAGLFPFFFSFKLLPFKGSGRGVKTCNDGGIKH